MVAWKRRSLFEHYQYPTRPSLSGSQSGDNDRYLPSRTNSELEHYAFGMVASGGCANAECGCDFEIRFPLGK